MAARRIKKRFWKLSNAGESHEPAREGYRCMVEEFSTDRPRGLSWDQVAAVSWGFDEVRDWNPDFTLRCDEPGPLEDMPWADVHIVSDRLRELLERLAPDCAQYLPMWLRPFKSRRRERYWIAHWIRVVRCHDPKRSIFEKNALGYRRFSRLVIDGERVPNKTPICRVKYDESYVIIRQDVKQALQAAGMTGCQFYSVAPLF